MGRLSSVVRDVRHGRRIIIAASVMLALALGGILAICLAALSLNRDAIATQTRLVDNALNQSIVEALSGVQTAALRDVAGRRLGARPLDKAWLDAEIGAYLAQGHDHDAVWILDPADRPIYAHAPGHATDPARLAEYKSDLDEIVAIARRGPAGAGEPDRSAFPHDRHRHARTPPGARGGWTAHIVGNRGRTVILSATTIMPATGRVAVRGRPYLIVTAVPVGARHLRRVADALLIPDLRATPLSVPATLSGRYVVRSDRGVPIERYEWTARTPGVMLLRYVLPLFVLVTAIAGLLLIVTLRRMQAISASLVDKEEEAVFLANYDPLSSLPNRRLFSQRLDAALAAGGHTTLAFCDLDNFKSINDTLGHEMGDLLIEVAARRLRDSFPDCVLVSRFGGDEFALMHSEAWLSVEAFDARIQQAFAEPVDLGGAATRVGISAGIAIAPDHGRDATDLMRNADIALYQAKDAGRARCATYHRGMRDLILVRKEREARLFQMLEGERFELHYQPIVDIRAACVSGMEALLRWPSDDPLPMSPAEFIPIAESAGLMPRLGDWIIRRAFADSLRWPRLWISINLSPLQIKAPDLLDRLERHLRATGADPRRIMFEITEGLLLDSTSLTRETLHGIRAMGFRMGLDDFGTGYSSLGYLQEFTFDKLKIDRSFICDGKLEEPRAASLVKAVIDVGRALGIEVVAEGVEHVREAVILKMLGCDQIQGWLYGRALPPARATEHLAALAATLRDPPAPGPTPALRLLSPSSGRTMP